MAEPTRFPTLDDCFASGQGSMALDQAIALLESRLPQVCGAHRVGIEQALGAILAEDVVSKATVPPHDNSAMDGYALAASSLEGGDDGHITLPVVRRIAAGDPPGEAVPAGAAVRIFTGAPMPPGTDTVIMQEDCGADPAGEGAFGSVTLPTAIKAGANRRFAGEDVQKGAVVLKAGRRLRGPDLAMIAATGHNEVLVRLPLRVGLFSTGDELRPPGSRLEPGQIYDSNRFGVGGCLRALGCEVTDLGALPDDRETIEQAMSQARGYHLLVTSGGVSVGEEDHVKAALESQGTLHFWRLAVKPGRPLALGALGDTVFLGLPGNPVAALVSLLVVGRRLIHRLQGRSPSPPVRYRLPAAFDFRKKAGRQEFIRAWIEVDSEGCPQVHRYAAQGSGVLSSLVRAEGLVDIPADTTAIVPGEMVDYLPLTDALW
jgi:molybdopterin molybdotransferase